MDIQYVLRKVSDLRKLAAKAGTVAEAEAAAARANALIEKYRLSEADVESANKEAPKEAPAECAPIAVSTKQIPKWHRLLVNIIARHYGCFMWTQGARGGQWSIRIVGRPSDVEVVRYMFAWISTEIARLAGREYGKADRNAFCLGACAGIRNALYQSTKAANAEYAQQSTESGMYAESGARGAPSIGSAAMVLASRGKESEEEARRTVKFSGTSAPARSSGSRDSYYRGREAGGKMHVGKALPGANRLLGS